MGLSPEELQALFDKSQGEAPEAATPAAPAAPAEVPEGQTPVMPNFEPVLPEQTFTGAIADVAVGVADGLQEGVIETAETIGWVGDAATRAVTGGKSLYMTERDGLEWLTLEEVQGRDDVKWQPVKAIDEATDIEGAETMPGQLASGAAQFVAGYGLAGKAMKSLKAASTAGIAAKTAAQGAVADFVAFDEHEDRLSDFLRDNIGLADPITAYLSADEDDTVLEGKLKNAVEGLGVGVAVGGIVKLVKSFKTAKKVQIEEGNEAAAKVMNDAVEELADTGQLELFDEISDPNLISDPAGPKKVIVKGGAEEAADETVGLTSVAAPKTETARQADEVEGPSVEAPDVDVSGLQSSIDREIAMVRAGSIPDPNRALDGKLFNFDRMDSDLSTKDFLNMASEAVPDELLQDTTTFAKMQDDARNFLADSVDVSPDVIDASLANMAQDMKKQQGVVIAGKQLVQSLAREIETLAYKISEGGATDADYARMVRLQSRAVEVSGNLKSVITGAAQTTAAGRIHTKDVLTGAELARADILKQMSDTVDSAGGKDKIKELAEEIMLNKRAGNGAAGTMRITADRRNNGPMAVINEVRINGLLSGPKTHVINLISNALQTTLLPGERILGGVMGGDFSRMREGAQQYAGIAMAIKDSLKASLAAGWRGRNIIDPEAALLEANGVDYRAITSTSNNANARNLVNSLGTITRLPSRGLLMGDELFKQINYRSDLYARLHTKASDLIESGKITREEAAKWVHARMQTGFASDGQATSRPSLEYAREATFTNELRKGSLAKRLQDATNAHPALKLILPFVRTPTNIIVASVQRTPLLHKMSKNMADDLASGDPSRVATARGKLATGSMLWGAAVMSAMEGKITGSGPVDPLQKARLVESGWQPYSLKVGDKFISYQRLDPFATFFGIAADFADIGGQLSEEDRSHIGRAALAAVANNLASKSWLQGITDAVDAFSNPEMRGESYMNSMATSMLPYSSLSRELRKAQDGQMRDTRGDPDASFLEMQSLVNSIKNTIPGYSESLPARRSWVTGEPIVYPKGWGKDMVTPLGEAFASMNPIYEGEWKRDTVLDELARLEFGFSPPTRSIRGVQLTPEQYETYLELNGKVRARGTRRTMYQELEKVMMSPTYDIGRQRAGNFSEPENDPRIIVVRRVMSAYRRLAQEEMIRRYPDLAKDIGNKNLQLQQNQRSMLSGVANLAGN